MSVGIFSDTEPIEMTSSRKAPSEEHESLERIFARIPYPVIAFDNKGTAVYLNEAFLKMWGLASPDKIADRLNAFEEGIVERRPVVADSLRRVFAGESVELYDLELRIEEIAHRYGSDKIGTVNIEAAAFPVYGQNNEVRWGVFILKDVSARKAAERALIESEKRYRVLAESLADGIYEAALDGTFLYANQTALDLFGYTKEEIIGKMNITKTVHPSKIVETQKTIELLLTGTEIAGERTFYRKDGSTFEGDIHVTPVYSEGRVTGIRGVVRDITQRKRLQEELQKLSRLESLGTLAGGIAHDFNNLFGALFGNIELAMAALQRQDISRAKTNLDQALKAYERATQLSGQILTFSNGGAPRKSRGTLSSIIERSLVLSSSGSNCKFETVIDEDLWPCHCDERQISQVLENLYINAMQSMPEGGPITVTASNTAVQDDEIPRLAKGRYIRVAVGDSGHGIPLEIHGKIFDPFFTTKQKAGGLGLSICYSIIKNHGGTIRVVQKPDGEGAEIELYVPAHVDETTEPAATEKRKDGQENRRVLYMDDEPLLRNLCAQLLGSIGCEVDTAEHGDQAIELYEKSLQNDKPYALVFLDLTVPGQKGGKQTLDILKSRYPSIIAVATSGYSNEPIMAAPKSFGFADKLVKPFRLKDLSDLVETLLHPPKSL